jgi:hypothetical protein
MFDAKKRPSASQLLVTVERAMIRSCGICVTLRSLLERVSNVLERVIIFDVGVVMRNRMSVL